MIDRLLTSSQGYTSHILEEYPTAGIEKALHNKATGRIPREYLVYLELFLKLLPLKFPRFRDFDHDARVDLVNEGDASALDPVDTRIPAWDIHG